MILLATDWLALAILLCVFAWYAGRWLALALPLAVTVAALAVYAPTGSPRVTEPPPGRYVVVGADIEIDVAIWALLKPEAGPAVYYRLPYSSGQAGALQEAKDGAGENGQVIATVGDEGGVRYDGPPPGAQGLPPKQAEQPAVSIP
ncbi:hypothetical protein [Mesorhizobium sp. M4B.F.Ca.ET.143.01.1.1]|uniref:hypothetical protein n=1 Tax=Mesorhizobium sp. M4B.F.Ca.ET.143.01.1.1 TaxID=2563947 RepID=UPI001093D29A|nr:hypothetical protein [Mesorhizobium sp. M4B.F.Ca.ET.143.01.1.1]TGV26317.1 hypothetical protein EN786_12390 [Mesorhizobium sp. M4B.F.Ca.ET.143.01.1.1]